MLTVATPYVKTRCGKKELFALFEYCNALQHTATHCNVLSRQYIRNTSRHAAVKKNYLHCLNTATHCNALQHTTMYRRDTVFVIHLETSHAATHCNTLQHTATHCNTLQHTTMYRRDTVFVIHLETSHAATHCNTLQHTATHCNTLQHTATHYNILLRHICKTSRHTAAKSVWQNLAAKSVGVSTRQNLFSAYICKTSRHAAAKIRKSLSALCKYVTMNFQSRFVCCRVRQCLAVCGRVLQCVIVWCSVV